MVRFAVRCMTVLSAAVGAFFLTWWLADHFLARDGSLAISSLVAGFILTVSGWWANQAETAEGSVTGSGNAPANGIGAIHSRTALVVTALVVAVVVGLFLTFRVRAQPAVTSPAAPPAIPVPADPTLRDGVVSEIASAETGLCAEVRDSSQTEGAIIDQGGCPGGGAPHQKFKAVAGVDPGTFKLHAIHSGKCMTVTDDKRVVQINCTDSTQYWRFRYRATARGWHYWEIRNTAYGGGFCLDLPGFSHEKGTPLQAWPCNNNNNQQWRTRI